MNFLLNSFLRYSRLDLKVALLPDRWRYTLQCVSADRTITVNNTTRSVKSMFIRCAERSSNWSYFANVVVLNPEGHTLQRSAPICCRNSVLRFGIERRLVIRRKATAGYCGVTNV